MILKKNTSFSKSQCQNKKTRPVRILISVCIIINGVLMSESRICLEAARSSKVFSYSLFSQPSDCIYCISKYQLMQGSDSFGIHQKAVLVSLPPLNQVHEMSECRIELVSINLQGIRKRTSENESFTCVASDNLEKDAFSDSISKHADDR